MRIAEAKKLSGLTPEQARLQTGLALSAQELGEPNDIVGRMLVNDYLRGMAENLKLHWPSEKQKWIKPNGRLYSTETDIAQEPPSLFRKLGSGYNRTGSKNFGTWGLGLEGS